MSKIKTTTKTTELQSYLQELRNADNTQVEAQLNIARILAGIRQYKLYKPHYDSFKMMVQCELDFSFNAAERYAKLHLYYSSFGYGREEFLKLMRQFGWRNLQNALQGSDKKMGYRAIKTWLADNERVQENQLHFNFNDPKIAKRAERVLKQHGLEINEAGRRSKMTDSLNALLLDYERLKKQENQTTKRTKKVA